MSNYPATIVLAIFFQNNFEFLIFRYMIISNEAIYGGLVTMTGKAKIYPTCRLCDKMNAEMTHCAIFGAVAPENINNTAMAAACSKSGDYVRLLHAVPNEYNYGRLPNGKTVDEDADSELLVYDATDEREGFQNKHGMTLEEWALQTFTGKKND